MFRSMLRMAGGCELEPFSIAILSVHYHFLVTYAYNIE
jgi:hypothetical protein